MSPARSLPPLAPADDCVHAIGGAGIRSAKVADLPVCLRTVRFPPLPQ